MDADENIGVRLRPFVHSLLKRVKGVALPRHYSKRGASSLSNNAASQLKNPVVGKTVFIDPGHGYQDSGATGNGLLEKNVNPGDVFTSDIRPDVF
jgi:N-acetylmuramoyl-L-alanine amidase